MRTSLLVCVLLAFATSLPAGSGTPSYSDPSSYDTICHDHDPICSVICSTQSGANSTGEIVIGCMREYTGFPPEGTGGGSL